MKDCTALANADGGVIIYGIEENEVDGVNVAVAFSPITVQALNKDWVEEVLRNGSSPPLTRYEISEIAFPDGSGRALAIEIEAATTAHQTLRDFRYYQRTGAVTSAMMDFQIKDLISRRSRPVVKATVRTRNMHISGELHRYQLVADVENVGSVTVEKWWMEIDIPAVFVRDTRNPSVDLMSLETDFHRYVRAMTLPGNKQIRRMAFGDPTAHGASRTLHPGQSMSFDVGYPTVLIEIDETLWQQWHNHAPKLVWRIFLPNSSPLEGIVEFDSWCRF